MSLKRRTSASDTEPRKKRIEFANFEPSVGIIEKVTLKNFMCHEHFSHSFGPRINILYGRNGSGKSAILTAIVIGLGGKPSFTGRGNLKTYIKNGKQSAKISTTLRNTGQDAYKPEVYGDEIVIERHLYADRGSMYKIRGNDGTFTPMKKEDLRAITAHFNIQVDNPVSVLTQECSRNFLGSRNPKDKYTFFCKATQLEKLQSDYTEARENIKITQDVLNRKEQILPALKKTVVDLRQKKIAYERLDEQKETKRRLENEYAWALINKKEKDHREHCKLVEMKENDLIKIKCRVEQVEKKLNELKEEKKSLEGNLKIINDKLEGKQRSKVDITNKYMEYKKILKKNMLDMQKVDNDYCSLIEEERNLLKKISELQSSGQQFEDRKQRLETLQLLSQSLTKHQTVQNQINLDDQNFKMSLNNCVETLNKEMKYKQNLLQKKNNLEKTLGDLNGSCLDHLRQFGQYVPELMRKLQSAYSLGKFSHKPKGPIGSLIKLKDPKWALAIESCLKRNLLCAFCCDNHKDASVLQTVINSVTSDHKPSVIVSRFLSQIYDTSPYEVRLWGFVNVLQIIECNDPVIINFLIDQRNIESILLVEQNNDARRIMINNPPANCRECFTLRGDRVFPSPNFRYYSCSKKNEEFLQTDVQNTIKEKQVELSKTVSDIHLAEENIVKHYHTLDEIKNKRRELERNRSEINLRINDVSNGIFEAKVALEQTPIDVNALEEDLTNVQKQKIHLQNEKQKLKQLNSTYGDEIGKGEIELATLDHDVKLLYATVEDIKEPLRRNEAAIEGADITKRHHDNQFKELSRKIAKLKEEGIKMKNLIITDIKKAKTHFGPRTETEKLLQNLENEIKQISCILNIRKATHGTQEEVELNYYKSMKAFNEIKKSVENTRNIVQRLDVAMLQRLASLKTIRHQLTVRVKHFFQGLLALHQCTGKLIFNHKDRTLEVNVQTKANVEKLNKDMKSLSGGERSFTTICLILAIWDTIETPFRILDEFDVYMDMVVRKLSTDMVLTTALHKKNTQFIIFTPLDHTTLLEDPAISIHVLAEPERGLSGQEAQNATESEDEEMMIQ